MTVEILQAGLLQFEKDVSGEEVKSWVTDRQIKTIQTSSLMNAKTWEILNNEFFTFRPDVELRVYSFVNDLSFIPRLTNVRRFSADAMRDSKGIELICKLEHLESLRIGIYGLNSFEFLRDVKPDKMQQLTLQITKSKKPSLQSINRFVKLKELYLEGQQKDIEVIGELNNLENLTLRSITVKDFKFLQGLKKLWSLDIKLGGSKNLSALEGMTNLKYLELWKIQGLMDISVISSLSELQFLFLQSLSRVKSLPDFSHLKSLRRILIDDLKGVEDISPLSSAPSLEEFIHISAHGMELEDYKEIVKMKTLKRISVGTGSMKKNHAILEMVASHGIKAYDSHREFVFR